MAIAATTLHELRATATAGNVNGGGFNPANANMPTDLTTDANTANTASPVVSSATYAFVAGDAGYSLYVKSGTNSIPGFYPIVSVTGGKATLNAAIGASSQFSTVQQRWMPSTVVGIATVGTPTNLTFAVDYSQNNTAKLTATDYTAVGGSTTMTSVTGGFTPVMVGNLFHQTTGGTAAHGLIDWLEIVSVTNGTTVVLDRTPNDGTISAVCTGFVGGALSLNTSSATMGDDDVFESAHGNGVAGNQWFFKAGAFTLGEAVAISVAATAAAPIKFIGYNTTRGDDPLGTSRPSVACAALGLTTGTLYQVYNITFVGSAAGGITPTSARFINCKSVNVATGANGEAWTAGSNCEMENCEGVSYRGNAVEGAGGSSSYYRYNWFHDSNIGISLASGTGSMTILGNVVSSCVTAALRSSAANTVPQQIFENTFYGAENKTGIGVDIATGVTRISLLNNIIYGFVTGVNNVDAWGWGESDYNDFNNNTADVNNVANWARGPHGSSLAPQFTNVTQVVGTTAVILSGNRIQDTSKNFTALGVVANAAPNIGYTNYVYYSAGSGAGVKGIYAITAITTVTNPNDTITVDLTLTADATADHGYQITVGDNFAIGTNLKALGFPGALQGGKTVGYKDIGAIQRQEAGSSGAFNPFHRAVI